MDESSYLPAFASNNGGQRFGIEPRVGEAKTTVHAVGRQLECFLSDVVLQILLGVVLDRLHQLLHLPPPLHQHSDLRWEYPGRHRGVRESELGIGLIVPSWTVGMVHCGEADVILLNDGGVEGVEVQQQDEPVVETTLWLQHKTTRICRLSLATPPCGCRGGLPLLSTCLCLYGHISSSLQDNSPPTPPTHLLDLTLLVTLSLVWTNIAPASKHMDIT